MLRTNDQIINKKVKLSFVTVPFSGHFNILSKLAKEMMAQNQQFDITLLVTGWTNINISEKDKQELLSSGINIVDLNHGNINSAQPMSFTFPRVAALTDQVMMYCKQSDYIVYDFFSIEGYIAGKILNIPTVCSIPAIMGPFDPTNKLFVEGKDHNIAMIDALEKKYGIEINNKLEMISDGFLLPSDYKNIQWSWPQFIQSTNYQANRHVSPYQFMRPTHSSKQSDFDLLTRLKSIKQTKKVIYVSLGTVVTQNLWEQVPNARRFIKNLFDNIKEKFQNSEKYEIVVATGRDCHDVLSDIPANFHVYKHVPQTEILALSDVFVTHAGGNSVNEAIDAGTPMVAIPFFGDQHVCASDIAKLNIGIAFPADDSESAVNTTACCNDRKSLNDQNALWKAVDKVATDNQYKTSIQALKKDQLTSINQLSNALINDKTLSWQEGDLLYGCNDDRKKLAELTDRKEFFKLCDTREFHLLFNDLHNTHSLPRIIDQYHDVLTVNKIASATKFNDYDHMLLAYKAHIQHYLDQLKLVHPDDKEKHDQIIWNMCAAGLDFFIKEQNKTIHFIIGKYNEQVNLATKCELEWIKKHWHDENVRNHVKFYNIQHGTLISVDPLQSNWLNERPTPSLEDLAPEKLNHDAFKSSMELIRAPRQHLFFNRSPERYKKEWDTLQSSGIKVIDINKSSIAAKQSLANGEVHIFTIQKNGAVTIAKRIADNKSLISHAVVANNHAVICAGEVRLRSICVNGKWLKALDISNRSGHYRPSGSTLLAAINAFESLGYIVHRVNVIREYIPSTLSKVEDEIPDFEPIKRSATI